MGRILITSLKRQCSRLLLMFAMLLVSFAGVIYAVGMHEADENIYRRWAAGLDYHGIYQLYDMDSMARDDLENDPELIKQYTDSILELKRQGVIIKAGTNARLLTTLSISKEPVVRLVYYGDFLSMVHLILQEGSVDPLLNYHAEAVIPVLISPALKESAKLTLGDTFAGSGDGHLDTGSYVFQVAGILHPDSLVFISGSSPVTWSLKKVKDQLLMVAVSPEETGDSRLCFSGIVKPAGTVKEGFSETVREVFRQNGMDVSCISLDEIEQQSRTSCRPYHIRRFMFALMTLLLSVLGLTGTVTAAINSRHEEFGIYLTLGFSRRSIFILLIEEIVIVYLSAFITAALIMTVYFQQTYMDPDKYMGVSWVLMDGRILWETALVMLITTSLSLIFPFVRIKKLSTIDLIREKE